MNRDGRSIAEAKVLRNLAQLYIFHLAIVMNETRLGSNANFPSSLARLCQLQPPKTLAVGKWGFRGGVVRVYG
jgi:hypothetical protein